MTKQIIKVLVVDNHLLLVHRVAGILSEAPDMQLVGHAVNGFEAVAQIGILRPDVTLFGIRSSGVHGLHTLSELLDAAPDARVLMLSLHRDESQIRSAISAGAAGYLIEAELGSALCDLIRSIHASSANAWMPGPKGAQRHLSRGEINVLKLAGLGYSNRRIGHALGVPEETIKSRMKSILSKLGANDRTYAVMLALRNGDIAMP